MAFTSIWYHTDLPTDIIELIERHLTEAYGDSMKASQLHGEVLNTDKRNSSNTWVPTTDWVGGFLWHYISRANRENFLYDLEHIDGESIQFTRYEKGEFYNWHTDAGLSTYSKPIAGHNRDIDSNIKDFLTSSTESVRKLSFVLQLSDPDDYEGGNLQLMDDSGRSHIAPRQRGTIICFDSRTPHRVQKVRSGVRKSLVGWTVGPRWK